MATKKPLCNYSGVIQELGSGDSVPVPSTAVVGPASAADGKVVLFDGTTGKLIKDSGLSLSGSNTGDQTLNQAAISGLTTSDSPVFATVKCSNLTDGYIPKHTSDAVGLANSPIYTDGTNVGIGTTSPVATLDVNGGFRSIAVGSTPSTGTGLEIYYNPNTPEGVIQAYDRTGSAWKDLLLGANGNQLFLKANGNVGVGTTGPNALLEINRNAVDDNAGLRLSNTSTNGSGNAIDWWSGYGGGKITASFFSQASGSQGGNFLFKVRDQTSNTLATRMSIDNNGNVGVGTTGPGGTWGTNLQIYSAANSAGISLKTGVATARQWDIGVNPSAGGTSQDLDFYDATAGLHRMIIQGSSGNVGVGTASPGAKLDISGGASALTAAGLATVNTKITSATSGYYTGMWFQGYTTSDMFLGRGLNTDDLIISTANQSQNELVRFKQNGNVGVGTASPGNYNSAGNLLVVGNSSGTGSNYGITIASDASGISSLFFAKGTTGNQQYQGALQYAHNATDANGYFQINAGGSEKVRIQGNGNVGIGMSPSVQFELSGAVGQKSSGTTWANPSDARLKENIELADLDRCYEIIKGIPLKRFALKQEAFEDKNISDRNKLGWVADDVEEFFPNAVPKNTFSLVPIPDGEEEYEEQDFTIETVDETVTKIKIQDSVPVQVTKTVSKEVKTLLFDDVAVVDEAGQPVMTTVKVAASDIATPGKGVGKGIIAEGVISETPIDEMVDVEVPLTHPVPRMIKKTRPKYRTDTIEGCRSLDADQIFAAMYGALQKAMSVIEDLQARIAVFEGGKIETTPVQEVKVSP
jgi:hypothetical protein